MAPSVSEISHTPLFWQKFVQVAESNKAKYTMTEQVHKHFRQTSGEYFKIYTFWRHLESIYNGNPLLSCIDFIEVIGIRR